MNDERASEETCKPFWRKHGPARRTFRWCRRSGYVVGLAGVYALVHLNQVGLPGFIKEPLIDELRERGLEIEFSRMRVRLGRGIVAEHVNVGRSREQAGEQVYADQLQIKLDWDRVLRLKPEISAVTVRGGKLVIPLTDTNGLVAKFAVDDIEGRLRFVSREVWELDQLKGASLGGTFQAAGSVTNAGLLRRKSRPQKPLASSEAWRRVLLKIMREADRTVFSKPPSLAIAFHADLADPLYSTAEVQLHAEGAVNSYGRFEDLRLSGELNEPPGEGRKFSGSFRLTSRHVAVKDVSFSGLKADITVTQSAMDSLPDRAEWRAELSALHAGNHRLGHLEIEGSSVATNSTRAFAARWNPYSDKPLVDSQPHFVSSVTARLAGVEITNAVSLDTATVSLTAEHSRNGWSGVSARLTAPGVETRWVRTGGVDAEIDVVPVSNPGSGDPADGPWKWLRPFSFSADIAATNIAHTKLAVDRTKFRLDWTNGVARFEPLEAMLLGGRFAGSAQLDVATRRLYATADSTIDAMGIRPLLTPPGQKWIGQFGWSSNRPPHVVASLGVVLPAWTNRAPDWRGEVAPTVTIAGSVTGADFTFRGIHGDTAEGEFTYTNRVWRVPGMTAKRPEGAFSFSYEGDEITKEYYFRLKSSVDPMIAAPLITEEKVRRVFDDFHFGGTTAVEGEVWGQWKSPELTTFRAFASLTNVTFRGEHLDVASARLGFTNRVLSVGDAILRDGQQGATVAGFAYDVGAGLISFTNAVSTFVPARVTRTIGPKVHKVMTPYEFADPPTVKVNGVIGVKGDPTRNDIRFDAESSGEFRWRKLRAKVISASVISLGNRLMVTNLDAGFYGGRLLGDLEFDLQPGDSDRFHINTEVRDADLGLLVSDLSSRTNRLEGFLSGRVRIQDGFLDDPKSWKGFGNARLRNGYLWDFPLFGAFSTVLDGVSPGLGKARFSEGTATFTIADGRLTTRDLEMKAPSMSLGYVGSVGFDQQIDMVVQGSMFREVPLLGPVVSLALSPFEKLFEYRLTGTFEKPVTAPAHVPSFFLFPFRPIGTIRDLLPDTKRPAPTANPVPQKPAGKPQ